MGDFDKFDKQFDKTFKRALTLTTVATVAWILFAFTVLAVGIAVAIHFL